jgi:sugar phosphate isomerase/epimerase
MEFGFRIFDFELMGQVDLPLIQISVLRTSESDIQRIKILADLIKTAGKRSVIHPMDVYLSDTQKMVRDHNLRQVKRFAEMADLGLIIHDEVTPDRKRLEGERLENFQAGLAELETICPVSIENARDSRGAPWFWQTFARQITFDIGHFESEGIDSLELAGTLSPELVQKLTFVHLHRSNGLKPNGLIDHWPVVPGCRELKTLRKLAELKPDIKVILELETAVDILESRHALRAESLLA